jgi:hypothetical protein
MIFVDITNNNSVRGFSKSDTPIFVLYAWFDRMKEANPQEYEIWGRIIPWIGSGTNAEFKIIDWANRSFWTPRVVYNILNREYLVGWNAFDTSAGLPGTPRDISGLRVSEVCGAKRQLTDHLL